MRISVGIDVAKATLMVCIRPSGEVFEVANDAWAHRALIQRFRGMKDDLHRIVMEATGGYETPVLHALQKAELPVARVSAHRAHAFARATGLLAKTDAVDARTLAHFADVLEPPVRAMPTKEQLVLQEIVQRRQQLVSQRDDERRRAEDAGPVAHGVALRDADVLQVQRDQRQDRGHAGERQELRRAHDPQVCALDTRFRRHPGVLS